MKAVIEVNKRNDFYVKRLIKPCKFCKRDTIHYRQFDGSYQMSRDHLCEEMVKAKAGQIMNEIYVKAKTS